MPIEIIDVRQHFAQHAGQTIKMLVGGPPGAGKTRLGSTFPNVIFADAEGRLLSIRDRSVRAVKIAAIKDLEDLRGELAQRPDIRAKRLGGPVDSVVIDTCDELARLIIKERLQAERKEQMAIADWGHLADKLRDILRGFRNLSDLNVLFNVHLRSAEDSETGRVEYRPAIQGAIGHEIPEYVDEAVLMVARPMTDPVTGERVIVRHLQTYPDAQHDWLKDHSGSLPLEFPVDFSTDYERLAKLIFGAIPVAPQSPTRAEEATAWTPPASAPSAEDDAERERLTEEIRTSALEMQTITAPPKKKAAAKKKATATLTTSEGTVEIEAPEGDVAPPEPPAPPPPPAELPVEATHPDTAVPENGTDVGEPAVEEQPAGPACKVCGTKDINENYIELSEARWGEILCRTHFLERNKQK